MHEYLKYFYDLPLFEHHIETELPRDIVELQLPIYYQEKEDASKPEEKKRVIIIEI